MIATLAGYTDIVNFLVVEKKADFRRLNLVPSCFTTAIHHSFVTIVYQSGAQCIHLAAKSGNLATLELIISFGADTNARTDTQLHQSPLHFAAANPTHEACQLLLSHGADIMAQDAVRALCLGA
jgi:ankyrin repeat protein